MRPDGIAPGFLPGVPSPLAARRLERARLAPRLDRAAREASATGPAVGSRTQRRGPWQAEPPARPRWRRAVRAMVWGVFLLADFTLAAQVLPEPLQLATTGGPAFASSTQPQESAARVGSVQAVVAATSAQLLWTVVGDGGVSSRASCQAAPTTDPFSYEAPGAGIRTWIMKGLAPATDYECRLFALDERGGASEPALVRFRTLTASA